MTAIFYLYSPGAWLIQQPRQRCATGDADKQALGGSDLSGGLISFFTLDSKFHQLHFAIENIRHKAGANPLNFVRARVAA